MSTSLEQAVKAHQLGDLETAERLYCEVLEGQPEQADASALLALIWNTQGKTTEALGQITKAVKVDSQSPLLKFHLANILLAAKRFSEAIFIFQEVIKLSPMMAEAHYNLGNALREIDDWGGSIAAYKEAIRISSQFQEAYRNLARTLYHEGLYKEALEIAKISVRMFPEYGESWLTLCTVANKTENYVLADEAGKICTRLLPQNLVAWKEYAQALRHPNQAASSFDVNSHKVELEQCLSMIESFRVIQTASYHKATPHRQGLPILLLYGNCHASAFWTLLNEIEAITSIFDVRFLKSYDILDREDLSSEDWANVALIFEQYTEQAPLKYDQAPLDVPRVVYPSTDCLAYWPLHATDSRNRPQLPHLPFGPYYYGDQIVIEMSKRPVSENSYEEYLEQSRKALPKLSRLLEIDKFRYSRREQKTDVKISSYIFSPERYGSLFWTTNHPKGELLREILRQLILSARFPLGVDNKQLWQIVERKTQGWEPMESPQTPLHPDIIKFFNLPLGENTKYLWNGKYLTHKEWVLEYLNYDFPRL